MQSKKLIYSILTGAFTAFVLTGCGATKPPTPSGIRVPVTEFAQQRQKEAMQKKEEAKLNFGNNIFFEKKLRTKQKPLLQLQKKP